ncbi:TKL/TKL-ccin protein kinase [Mycena venus]|uniref:TKL/TKL-ccin protein kinase n=1 Tax=Mycena venus TaxID=2733690 RepID=A0A8H6XNL8_9AGAR|nr:TKL/TKL-ccin protein kinase [Mycena venus]
MPGILDLKFKVCSKVASYLEQGHRLENLSWRLWHLQTRMVGTDNFTFKREFKKLSQRMSDQLDKERGQSIEELSAPDFKSSSSIDLIRQRAVERERTDEARSQQTTQDTQHMRFTFTVDRSASTTITAAGANPTGARASTFTTVTVRANGGEYTHTLGPAALVYPPPSLTSGMNYGEPRAINNTGHSSHGAARGVGASWEVGGGKDDDMKIVRPTSGLSLDELSNSEEDLVGKYVNEGVRRGAHTRTDSPRKSLHLGTRGRSSRKESWTNCIPHDEEDGGASSGEETFFEDTSVPAILGRDLAGKVTQDDQYPFAGGGNSNLYRGKLICTDGRKIRVAIKLIRLPDGGSGQMENILRRLKREVDVWSRLNHKNVLPFIGICEDIAPWPVLISPYYKFGHVGTYLKKHPSINRRDLVTGVACGLQYLHAHDIVHGDLKVPNVLVDKRGAPCICDFGISKILNHQGFTTASVGTVPYMAPELFSVLDGVAQEASSPTTTKNSDVYSFALLVLEILTSAPPKGRPTRAIVTAKTVAELRPKRTDYDGIREGTWLALSPCWSFEPHLRPTITEVLRALSATH